MPGLHLTVDYRAVIGADLRTERVNKVKGSLCCSLKLRNTKMVKIKRAGMYISIYRTNCGWVHLRLKRKTKMLVVLIQVSSH